MHSKANRLSHLLLRSCYSTSCLIVSPRAFPVANIFIHKPSTSAFSLIGPYIVIIKPLPQHTSIILDPLLSICSACMVLCIISHRSPARLLNLASVCSLSLLVCYLPETFYPPFLGKSNCLSSASSFLPLRVALVPSMSSCFRS